MVSTPTTTRSGSRDRLPSPYRLNGHTAPRTETLTTPVRVLGPDGIASKSLDLTFGQALRLQLGGSDEIARPLEENPWLYEIGRAHV